MTFTESQKHVRQEAWIPHQQMQAGHPTGTLQLLQAENQRLRQEVELHRQSRSEACELAIGLLVNIANARDLETGRHVKRVQRYALLLASALTSDPLYPQRLSRGWIQRLAKVVPLHDIGKIGIPDRILLKPAPLDPFEYEVMQRHTRIGHDIIAAVNEDCNHNGNAAQPEPSELFQMAMDVALWHHERWDGAGYPDGLAGEAIPLAARIVSVADVFDALTSTRIYKEAVSVPRAAQHIISLAGTKFDPGVVRAFERLIPEFELISCSGDEAPLPGSQAPVLSAKPHGHEAATRCHRSKATGATSKVVPFMRIQAQGSQPPAAPQQGTAPKENPMRALIVDDDELDCRLLERVLSPYCQVECVKTGEEALEKFGAGLEQEAPYGLVCLDYRLPGMTGAKTAQMMRDLEGKNEKFPMTTLCAVSGSPEAAGEFYMHLGNDPHFFLNQKPYNRSNLLKAISFGLRRWGVKSEAGCHTGVGCGCIE
ncbi:HD domain-containing protein [Geomonas subterranea]|uniref:HD domain-containing protein n=1 Tax=Geomonas subterranea TaxID=2847989 RepID=A0ABX8LKW1_9BACT|nr:response regulator [Geomonas subterranea]QXE90954.1 HD domain-containing protein [Geomonas subterranea]